MFSIHALTSALALATGLGPTALITTVAAAPGEAADEETKAQAKAHVQEAVAAFAEARWEAALESFEAAKALRYSPKLDFNIAIVHEKLLEKETDATSRSFHAAKAIAAYQGYLEALPEATDRADVEARIDSLSRPVPIVREESEARTLQPTEGADPVPAEGPSAPPSETTPDPDPDPQAPAPPPKTWDATGYFHVTPMLGFSPQLADATGTEAAGTLLLEASGGATIGKGDHLVVGGALAAVFGGAAKQDTYGFGSFHVGATIGASGIVTTSDRLLLEAHVLAALSRQALRTRNDAVAPGCTQAGDTNALVGARLGFRSGARLSLGVLLGPRRRHGLTFNLYPSVGVYGGSSTGGATCDGSIDPFEAAGIDERVTFDLWSGLGYQIRI